MPTHLERTKRPHGTAIDVDVLKRKSWPGFSAEFVRIAPPAVYDFRVAQLSNYICMTHLRRSEGETCTPGLPRSYTKDLRNKLTFAPVGCEIQGWSKIDKGATFITVSAKPAPDSRRCNDPSHLPPRLEFEDQMMRSLMLRFQAILHDPTLDVPGYAETLGELLVFELQRVAAGQSVACSEPGGLSRSQVRIITDYMDEHLAEKTSIAELARLLDLTRFHFIRSFKHATGMPPHQYLIRLRVDRAKEMLSDGRVSVAEAASRTGFGSPIQLTRAFRRIVGTTPSAFRGQVL